MVTKLECALEALVRLNATRSDTKNMDHASLTAVGAIGVGWFLMGPTLVVNFGPWQQSIHFYDVWAVHPRESWWAFKPASIARMRLQLLRLGYLCAAAVISLPAIYRYNYKRKGRCIHVFNSNSPGDDRQWPDASDVGGEFQQLSFPPQKFGTHVR